MTDPYQTRKGKVVMALFIIAAALFMLWGFLNSLDFQIG